MPLVEAELRRLARACMGRERKGHTLQPTALVNESVRRLAVFAVLALIVVVPFAACGGNSATAPSAPAASVVPFALVGGVFDTARTPLAQARVEVVNGAQKGTAVMTDDAGAFAFGKIFTAPFTLRASKDGRRDQSRQISNAQSDGVFTLAIELAGNYQVVFAADAACTSLPAVTEDCVGTMTFDGPTFDMFLSPRGDQLWLIQTNPNNVFAGSAKRTSRDVRGRNQQ